MNLDIIIVNYNSGPYLKKCLDSISPAFNGDLGRVLIIDNASSDGSIINLQSVYPHIQIIRNQQNLGFARAVNQGIRITTSPYLLLINPDAELQSASIDKMLQFMETKPDCGVLGGLVLYPDGRRQETVRSFPTFWTVLLGRRSSLTYKIFPHNPFSKRYLLTTHDFTKTQEVDFVAGTFMMLRRKALEEIGLFDEDYFCYVEDVDICWRMKEKNWKVYFYPEARCVHLYGENIRKDNIHPEIYHARGMYHFFNKYYQPNFLYKSFLTTCLYLKICQIIAWGFLKLSFAR